MAQEALVQFKKPVTGLTLELPIRPFLEADVLVGLDTLFRELLRAVVTLLSGAVALNVARDQPCG